MRHQQRRHDSHLRPQPGAGKEGPLENGQNALSLARVAEHRVTGSSGSLETSRRGWTEARATPHPLPYLRARQGPHQRLAQDPPRSRRVPVCRGVSVPGAGGRRMEVGAGGNPLTPLASLGPEIPTFHATRGAPGWPAGRLQASGKTADCTPSPSSLDKPHGPEVEGHVLRCPPELTCAEPPGAEPPHPSPTAPAPCGSLRHRVWWGDSLEEAVWRPSAPLDRGPQGVARGFLSSVSRADTGARGTPERPQRAKTRARVPRACGRTAPGAQAEQALCE